LALLHKLVVQRQAVMLPGSAPLSEMSLTLQASFGLKGELTSPNKTLVGKHSRRTATNKDTHEGQTYFASASANI